MPRTKQQKPRHIVDRENRNDEIGDGYFSDSANVISKNSSEDELVEDIPFQRAIETVTKIDGNKNFIDPCSPEISLHPSKDFNDSGGVLTKSKQTVSNMDGAVIHSFKSNSVCLPPNQSLSNQEHGGINKTFATNESVRASRNQDDTLYLQRLSEENTLSRDYVNDWLHPRKSGSSPTSNDVQYKVLSAAAAQYVQNIKKLMENKSSETSFLRNRKDKPVTPDFWSMLTSAGKQHPHHAEHIAQTDNNLVHSYISNLSKRWTSIINQKLSKKEEHNSIYSNCNLPFGKSADQNSRFEPNNTLLSEKTSRDLYVSKPSHGNIGSKDDQSSIECSPSLKITCDSTLNRGFKIASPHSAPASFSDQFSPWQQLAVSQRDQQTIRPWSSTGPLGILSPQDLGDAETSSFPSPVCFSPIPNVKAHLKTRDSEISHNLNTASINVKQHSISSIKSSNQGSPCPKLSNSSSPANINSCNLNSDISPMTNISGNEIAMFTPNHINTVCSQLQMPYLPISTKLLGSSKLPSGLLSSPFGGLPAPVIQTPLFLPGQLPLGGFCNTHLLTSHFGNIGQSASNVDTTPQVHSAGGKINSSRKSRSRGQPIDSVHAAIVREAKEQFKGLDPENMYIQCPICQKRIKRLYHFQRHMRIHTGEKTHQCPCCQYKSVRKDNLKSHMKTHEKQSIENSRRTVHENTFQERRAHQYADGRKSSVIENNEEEPEKQQRALPAHRAANEYSASFTSSYASPYPFPYFPHQQYSSSPYVNISPSRLQQHHQPNHRDKATVKGETSAIITKGKYSRKSDSSSSDPLSPDADNPTNKTTIVNNSAPLSHGQSTNKPKHMSDKNIFRAIKNSEDSLQQSDISLVKTWNDNQNNSNSTKTGHIFRTWGNDDVAGSTGDKLPTTTPFGGSLDNSSITSTDFQNFNKFSAGQDELTIENLALVKKEHQGNIQRRSLQLNGTSCLTESVESAVMYSEQNNVKSEPEKKSTQHSNGDTQDEKYENVASPTKEILACRLCQFRAISNNDLQTHLLITHKHDGFYKCDVCNYLGKNLSKLVEHIRIHTGERPFKCDQCNYAAKRKDNLAQHKAVRHDKRKDKSGSLYISVDPNNGQRKDESDEGFRSTKRIKKDLSSKKSPLIQSCFDFEKSSHIKSTAGNNIKNNVEQGGVSYAPLFHKYSTAAAVPALPHYMYPFCFPSPLMHAADLGGQVNGSHSPSAQLSNPGSYSLKVRAALITP